MLDRDYLEIAVEQAKKSVQQNGFPDGAVVVKNNQIIAQGISIGNVLHDPTAHAENASIRAACLTVQSTDLQGATLYASLQPCLMCFCAANWAGVTRIVYGCRKVIDMVNRGYYEGVTELETINEQNTRKVELVYIPEFESEMRALIATWERNVSRS